MFWQKVFGKWIASIFAIMIAAGLFTACGTNKNNSMPTKVAEADSFAMGTIISQKVYGANGQAALDEVTEKIAYLEKLLTFNAARGDIYNLNQNAGIKSVKLDRETIAIIEKAQQVSELSNGAFDITVGPLVQAWGIGSERQHVPTAGELQNLLPLVDYQDIHIDGSFVGLERKGQMVDLGGIAKGYAGDAAIGIYKRNGIDSAIISIGGNVVTLGKRPDGSPWRIGIRNPRPEGGKNIGIVEVTDKAVVTAGDDQRFFEEGGQRYHHILDPDTGYPAKSDLMSVTLILDSSFEADALDTAVFILGLEKGKELIRQYGGVEAVFVTTDKKIHVTDGLKNSFTFINEGNDYEYVK